MKRNEWNGVCLKRRKRRKKWRGDTPSGQSKIGGGGLLVVSSFHNIKKFACSQDGIPPGEVGGGSFVREQEEDRWEGMGSLEAESVFFLFRTSWGSS